MNSHEVKVLLSLVAIYLARMLGLFLLFPVWALFVERYEFPAYWVGASLIGLYGLSQALMQIPMGRLSDRIGRRAALALGLLLLFAGGAIAAIGDSAVSLLIGRLLQGCGATSAVAMAVVADEISAPNRIKATAIIGASIGLSFGLAMLLAPLLADLGGGIRLIFAFSAALALLAGLLALTLPARTPPEQTARPAKAPARLGRTQVLLCLGIFGVHAALSAIFLVLPPTLSAIGVAASKHGFLYGAALLLAAPFALARLGSLRRIAVKPLIPIDAAAAMLLGWLLLVAYAPQLSGSAWPWLQLGLLLAVYFYGFTILESSLPVAFMSLMDESHRGRSLGFFAASQFLGSFAGGLAIGLAVDLSAPGLAHALGIAAMAAWAIAMRLRAREPAFAEGGKGEF